MIVFDVVANGEVVETITPVGQQIHILRSCLFDRVYDLNIKYGEYKIFRRLTEMEVIA